MTPTLVQGDLLRTETVSPADLRPGMVCVFEAGGFDPVVHRITGLRNLKTFSVVNTRGDASGRDYFRWVIDHSARLERVTGVLRAGRYRPPESFSLVLFHMPAVFSKRLAAIVRRLLW